MTIPLSKNINPLSTLYDRDHYLWLEASVKQLKEKQIEELDWEHLTEEIEDLARNYRRELKSRLIVLLAHFLKWKYQPAKLPYYGNSWISTINEQRRQIELVLEDCPSLKPYLEEILTNCYTKARREASKEICLAVDIFPVACPFTIEETLDFDYLPS